MFSLVRFLTSLGMAIPASYQEDHSVGKKRRYLILASNSYALPRSLHEVEEAITHSLFRQPIIGWLR